MGDKSEILSQKELEKNSFEMSKMLQRYKLVGVPASTAAYDLGMPEELVPKVQEAIELYYLTNSMHWLKNGEPMNLLPDGDDEASYKRIAEAFNAGVFTEDDAVKKLAAELRDRRDSGYRCDLEKRLLTVRCDDIFDKRMYNALRRLTTPVYFIVKGRTEFVAVPARLAEKFYSINSLSLKGAL